ncbi:MAG: leucine-rich repeat domain-containing protein [Pirellulales bacterium]
MNEPDNQQKSTTPQARDVVQEPKKDSSKNRLWLPKFRFSMRTLFILVTLLCVLLVPLSVRIYQARQQRLAVEWVLANGGYVYYDYHFDEQGAWLAVDQPSDNLWFRSMLGNDFFDAVEEVSIHNPTDADLLKLTQLQSLNIVRLLNPQDADLSPLGSLKQLDSVTIRFFSKKSYTEKHLADLSKLDCRLNISLSGQFIDDLTPIQQLSNLSCLWITDSQVTDLAPLIHLTQIDLLDLQEAPVKDLSVLSSLSKLKSFRIKNSQVNDFSPIFDLTQLEILGLEDPNITDLTPLTKLINMRSLTLHTPNANEFSPLGNLISLEELDFDDPSITDLAPLAKLVNLRHLTLETPKANDLTPLGKLINLQFLTLKTPKAKDLSPLLQLSNLEYLNIQDVEFTIAELDKLKKALPNCEIVYAFTWPRIIR